MNAVYSHFVKDAFSLVAIIYYYISFEEKKREYKAVNAVYEAKDRIYIGPVFTKFYEFKLTESLLGHPV